MVWTFVGIGAFFFSILVIGTIWAITQEKKSFNNGLCISCHEPLRLFDLDSQGGRGYVCTKCRRKVWVSYNVDRDYRLQNKEE